MLHALRFFSTFVLHPLPIKLTVIIIVGYHCYQLHTKFYRISSFQD
jgi:hypothetical protein